MGRAVSVAYSSSRLFASQMLKFARWPTTLKMRLSFPSLMFCIPHAGSALTSASSFSLGQSPGRCTTMFTMNNIVIPLLCDYYRVRCYSSHIFCEGPHVQEQIEPVSPAGRGRHCQTQ